MDTYKNTWVLTHRLHRSYAQPTWLCICRDVDVSIGVDLHVDMAVDVAVHISCHFCFYEDPDWVLGFADVHL